jgi:hypothetical protein
MRQAIALVLAGLVVVGCGPSFVMPTAPAEILAPETVGVIVDWEPWNGHEGRYVLDSGRRVELNIEGVPGLPDTPRLSIENLQFEGEPVGQYTWLLLSGQDQSGRTWYAAASEVKNVACPFAIQGDEIFDEGDHLLFGTGLALRKAPGFEVHPDWLVQREDMKTPFPLSAADSVCLDRTGAALSAEIWLDR